MFGRAKKGTNVSKGITLLRKAYTKRKGRRNTIMYRNRNEGHGRKARKKPKIKC
jgi:hypothetical protein